MPLVKNKLKIIKIREKTATQNIYKIIKLKYRK